MPRLIPTTCRQCNNHIYKTLDRGLDIQLDQTHLTTTQHTAAQTLQIPTWHHLGGTLWPITKRHPQIPGQPTYATHQCPTTIPNHQPRQQTLNDDTPPY